MAEGGDEFGYDNPTFENDNDDSDFLITSSDIKAAALLIPEREEKLSVTAPFVPSGFSTPYHGGEEIEMPSYDERTTLIQTVTNEDIQRRLDNLRNKDTGMIRTDIPAPPKLEDFIDVESEIQKVKNFIKSRFPNAEVEKMNLQFSKNPKKRFDIVIKGPKTGETKVLLDNGSGFQKKFLNLTFVIKSLGESYEELSHKQSQIIHEETQKLLKDQILLKDAEAEVLQKPDKKDKILDKGRYRQKNF